MNNIMSTYEEFGIQISIMSKHNSWVYELELCLQINIMSTHGQLGI